MHPLQTTPLKELTAKPKFRQVVHLWDEKEFLPPAESVYKKPLDHLLVIRDNRLMEVVKELTHVLIDTGCTTRGYSGQYLDMPVIDMEAMLEYLCSDLDKIIAGELSAHQAIHRYVIMEVLDHDAEFTPLLKGVTELVEELFQILSRSILEHPIDHYAPHRYELQELLPSGGLVLRRVDI